MPEHHTNIIQDYLDFSKKHPDALILMEIGDFIEAFFDSAHVLHKELNFKLSTKTKNNVPMSGFPKKYLNYYSNKLAYCGYKVAVIIQKKSPSQKCAEKFDVTRSFDRLVTPGTVNCSDIQIEESNYIVSINADNKGLFIVHALDVNSGDQVTKNFKSLKYILSFLLNLKVLEIVIKEKDEHIKDSLNGFSGVISTVANDSKDILRDYLISLNLGHLSSLSGSVINFQDNLDLPYYTFQSIDVFDSSNGLFRAIDKTSNSYSKRLLRRWLRMPTRNHNILNKRYDIVDFFLTNQSIKDHLKGRLKEVGDIDRSVVSVASKGSYDIGHFICISRAISIYQEALSLKVPYLIKYPEILAIQEQLSKYIDNINGDINIHHHAAYNLLYQEYQEAQETLDQYMLSLAKNIDSQYKFDYDDNGPYIHSKFASDPPKIFHKNNLQIAFIVKGKAYFIGEGVRDTMMSLKLAKVKMESEKEIILDSLRNHIIKNYKELNIAIQSLGAVDILSGFADLATANHYTRPNLVKDGDLYIKDLRHFQASNQCSSHEFIANDYNAHLGGIKVITGPNMSGKSTYIKSIAAACLIAYIGCYVPATSAAIPMLDGIYIRSGASDNLHKGHSTLMSEMLEIQDILSKANKNSLILLDEVAMGTSAKDSIAISSALVKYFSNSLGAYSIITTHHSDIFYLLDSLKGVEFLQMSFDTVNERTESGNQIRFLYKVQKGVCWNSYGVAVAESAGWNLEILSDAKEYLKQYRARHDKVA